MKMHTDTDAHDCSHDSDSESTYEPSEYWPESDALKELTKRGSDTNARNYCHDSDSESTYEPSEYYSESDALKELTKRGAIPTLATTTTIRTANQRMNPANITQSRTPY